MKENNDLHSELLNEINNNPRIASILDRRYLKKKLINWLIRNFILTLIYIVFWKYENIRWTLYITIPFAFISLLMIYLLPVMLNKKLARTSEKLNHLSQFENNFTIDDYKEMYKEMEYDVLAFKEQASKVNHHEIIELCDGFFEELKISETVSNIDDAETFYNELMGYLRQIEDIIENEGIDEE